MQVEKHVRWLWRFIMMPILFGLIGNAMRFKTLPNNIIPKACAIIFAGRNATLQNGPGGLAHRHVNCCALL